MRADTSLGLVLIVFVLGVNVGQAAPIGLVQSTSGGVWKYSRTASARHVKAGDAFESEVSISTGPKSNAVLRFQDGQFVALGSNTTFRVKTFTFNATEPASGQILFELVKGGLRSVTGRIGEMNRSGWQLVTPNAIVKVSGTDFLVVMDQSLYAHVNAGAVTLSNTAGTTALAAGQSAFVAGEFAVPVATTAVPNGIFGELHSVVLTPSAGAPAPGAGGVGSGGAAAAVNISNTALALALGTAAIVAGAGGGSNTTTHH